MVRLQPAKGNVLDVRVLIDTVFAALTTYQANTISERTKGKV